MRPSWITNARGEGTDRPVGLDRGLLATILESWPVAARNLVRRRQAEPSWGRIGMTEAEVQEKQAGRPPAAQQSAWHAMPAAQALERQGSAAAGLDDEEAGRRLERHGPNAL